MSKKHKAGAERERLRVERPKVNGQSRKASTAAQGKAVEDRLEVYKLKVHGALSFREIGERMGIAASTAYGLFKDTMVEINAECRSLGEHYREIETARLEKQREEVKGIHDGTEDEDVALKSHAILLRIAERFAKLYGLDAPTQTLVAEGVVTEFTRLLGLLSDLLGAEVQMEIDELQGKEILWRTCDSCGFRRGSYKVQEAGGDDALQGKQDEE